MSNDPRTQEATSFTEELFALLAAARTLVGGHIALLRAELAAIFSDVVALIIGAIAIVSLLTTALVALLVALALIAGEALYGSSLWGAAHLTELLLAVATAILSSLLRIDRGRRGRSALLALVTVAAIGAALVGALGWSAGPALGLAITAGLLALLVDLIVGLASFDAQRFADRFRPLASEEEFRATVAAMEGLRDEALSGVGEEIGAAVGSADEALRAVRRGTATVAEALRRVADRLRDNDVDDSASESDRGRGDHASGEGRA